MWELPPLPGRIFSVDITADGRTIAAGSSLDGHGHVHVYRMEPRRRFPNRSRRFSTSRCINRSGEEKAQLHKHFEQGVQTLAEVEVAEGGVYAVALSPNGDRVAAAGGDGTVRLFDTQSGSLVASFVPVEISKRETSRCDAADANQPKTIFIAPSRHCPGDAIVWPSSPSRFNWIASPLRAVVVTAELASGAKVDVTRQRSSRSRAGREVNAAGSYAERMARQLTSRSATSRPASTSK